MNIIQLLGSTLGLGLVSGINLYATVLVVGVGIRLGWIVPRPELHDLEVLSNPIVIGVAGVLFVVEFLADKIQWVDSVWDSIHTFIRPVGAVLIGVAALGETSPASVVIALLCGGVALSGHSTKAGVRLLVNHSPEPVSNVVLSLVEDVLVVVGAYIALQYPYAMLIVVVVFVIGFLWFAPKAFRLVRIEVLAIFALCKKFFANIRNLFSGAQSSLSDKFANDEMPVDYVHHAQDKFKLDGQALVIKSAAGKGVRGLRHSIGYFNLTPDQVVFISKRLLRLRDFAIPRNRIEHVHFKKQLLLDRLVLKVAGKQHIFYFFKDASNRAENISTALEQDPNHVRLQ